MSIAVMVGNPQPRSRSYQAAHLVTEKLAGRQPDLSVDLTDLGSALLDWSAPALAHCDRKPGKRLGRRRQPMYKTLA